MLVGLLWAAFAPLLLLPAIVLARLALRRLLPGARGWLVAALLVLAPVVVAWAAAHAEFARICDSQGRVVAVSTAVADGIFLDSSTANSFGMRYLQEEGFAWVEARSVQRRDGFVRYAKGPDGRVTTTEFDGPVTARFEVREQYSEPAAHTRVTVVSVLDRRDGSLLAKAGSAQFDGGPAKWVLGAWGSRSCPWAGSDPGGFSAFYHLARDTLRPRRG